MKSELQFLHLQSKKKRKVKVLCGLPSASVVALCAGGAVVLWGVVTGDVTWWI